MGVSTFWPGEVLRENGPDDIDPKEMLLDVHRYEIDVMYSRPEDGFTQTVAINLPPPEGTQINAEIDDDLWLEQFYETLEAEGTFQMDDALQAASVRYAGQV